MKKITLILLCVIFTLEACENNKELKGVWVEENYKIEQVEFTDSNMIFNQTNNTNKQSIIFKYEVILESVNFKKLKVKVYIKKKIKQERITKIEFINENKITISAIGDKTIKATTYTRK